jgi:hypothetical protein
MRKITKEAVKALLRGDNFKCSNTEVRNKAMYLFDSKIAYFAEDGELYLSNCGYATKVTGERLNGIIEATIGHEYRIYQKNFVWYYGNNKNWDDATELNGYISISNMKKQR